MGRWDPRVCPHCGDQDDTNLEAACTACGKRWDPDSCPDCQGSGYRTLSLPELLYPKDGLRCRECGHRWQPTAIEERDACPECHSEEFEDSYPDVPDLAADDPLLYVIYAAETQIPRAENGAILTREMVAWLRLHGVRSRAEILQWEAWFMAIGGFRAKVQEELRATAEKQPNGEQDEDRGD